MFSQAPDEASLINSEESSSSLVIAPTSHSNLGRFFNSPSKVKNKNSCLPSRSNLELMRICIETQVRILLKSIKEIQSGEHLVWDYNRKD